MPTTAESTSRIRASNPADTAGSAKAATIAVDGQSATTRIPLLNDLGARGISPLLLPHPGLTFGIAMDPPELVRPEDRQMTSRLLPRDYRPLGARDNLSSRSFNASYGGRGAFHQFSSGDLTTEMVILIFPIETNGTRVLTTYFLEPL